ncbi:2Fe-2S ferredoxin [Novosphingobium hassiacum]|uniref:2Fe-2S ferredoxin n=1 Tax=Novosphingobium hassiacum TaxID=173676 RepID=A0A7W6A1I1_9SPHN|nr:2Fe-2S iron-sulfur cluster-binding protein [Novosphingobium hassiacum]MBB3862327.1 2Fe-2S ferredoxin [Novosphingobium hassiacum]
MVTITFFQPDGSSVLAAGNEGETVMEVARAHGVEGIEGECGGAMACGTCHVYVDEAFRDAFPAIGHIEDAVLDSTETLRTEQSRLSCQLPVTAQADGARMTVPGATA